MKIIRNKTEKTRFDICVFVVKVMDENDVNLWWWWWSLFESLSSLLSIIDQAKKKRLKNVEIAFLNL